MKKTTIEKAIRICAVAVLALSAYKCAGQTPLRINTAPGIVEITDSNDPNEICIRFGDRVGEVRLDGMPDMQKTSAKLAMFALKADRAGVNYETFISENGYHDCLATRRYYNECLSIRWQFLSIMPERVFLEIRHISQYFQ